MCRPGSGPIPTRRCCSAWRARSRFRPAGSRHSSGAVMIFWTARILRAHEARGPNEHEKIAPLEWRAPSTLIHLVDLQVTTEPIEEAAAVQRQGIGQHRGLDFLEFLLGKRIG